MRPARGIATILLGITYAMASSSAIERSGDCLSSRGREGRRLESQCFSIQHDGRERTFRLYVPAHPARSMPLLVVLHGGGGSGAGMEALTDRGFDRIADREHLLVLYPDGIGKSWNDGRGDLKSKAVKGHADDLGFLTALVHELAQSYPVDSARVYATGISNGGMMSYRLACEAGDVFAAVAPVAANLSVELASRCHPSRAIPILIIEGTEDPIMPWGGGAIKVLWLDRGEVLSTLDTFERWKAWDRCPNQQSRPPLDRDPSDGTSVAERVATGCAGGVEVQLDEVRGGGHTWPDGLPYLGVRIVGRVSREIDANEVIWTFFSRFSLQDAGSDPVASENVVGQGSSRR